MILMRLLSAAAFAAGLLLAAMSLAQPLSGRTDIGTVSAFSISGSVTPVGISPGGGSMYEESLEWMVADSKLIVRATIEAVTDDAVTLRVTDRLKGQAPVQPLLTVARQKNTFAPKPGVDALIFLNDNKATTQDRYP